MKHSPDYLLQMIRQIAANQPRDFDDETNARRVASHLQRFWAPSMLADAQGIPDEQLDAQTRRVLAIPQSAEAAGS